MRVSYITGLALVLIILVSAPAASAVTATFSAPVLIGFPRGDDWEPDVAADGNGLPAFRPDLLHGLPDGAANARMWPPTTAA